MSDQNLMNLMKNGKGRRRTNAILVTTDPELIENGRRAGYRELLERYGERGLRILSLRFEGGRPEAAGHERGKPPQPSLGDAEGVDLDPLSATRVEVRDPFMDEADASTTSIYRELDQGAARELRVEQARGYDLFLVDAQGQVVSRFEGDIDPLDEAMITSIERTLPGDRS